MADYYTRFSIMLEDLTDEELTWWRDRVARGEDAPELVAEVERPNDLDLVWPPCEIEIDDTARTVWLYSVESADLEGVSYLLQEFLKDTNSDRIVPLEWSNDCSRPRLDAYGGGAMVMSRDRTVFMTTGKWADQAVEALKAPADDLSEELGVTVCKLHAL